MKDKKVGLLEEDKEELDKKISAILYHLKYRNTNPQTLELLLIGIDMGQLVPKL